MEPVGESTFLSRSKTRRDGVSPKLSQTIINLLYIINSKNSKFENKWDYPFLLALNETKLLEKLIG